MSQVVGIGIDLVEIERVEKAYQKETFQKKYYSESERALIEQRQERAASAFAGKEAVVKAMGTGFRGISPADIEILRNDSGAPYVRLSEKAKRIADEQGMDKIHISLSDTEQMAAAYVVAEREDA